eukprot:scaffold267931_cov13-Tisochrysis_lutea.AAC.1
MQNAKAARGSIAHSTASQLRRTGAQQSYKQGFFKRKQIVEAQETGSGGHTHMINLSGPQMRAEQGESKTFPERT